MPTVTTTPAALLLAGRASPAQDFVVGDDGRVTYGEALQRVAELAAGLAAAGVSPGDRVGLLLPNGVRWCLAALAVHAAGGCVVR